MIENQRKKVLPIQPSLIGCFLLNFVFLLAVVLNVSPLSMASEWSVSSSFLLAKEQARSATGESGGPLFEDRQLAFWLHWYYPLSEAWVIGPYLHYENGGRRMCGYTTDVSGVPGPVNCESGDSNQIWFGPAAQYRWKSWFIEAQYILFGRRADSAYGNLSSPGSDSTTFSTHPLRAWVFTPGASIPLSESIKIQIKIEYRFVYYSGRGGRDLPGDQVYGNQAIRPQIGLMGEF